MPPSAAAPRFRTVILDVDSTLSGIEGIDWLAERRGAAVARQVADATERAMRGEIPLDAVYGERLALVRPGRDELAALAQAYWDAIPDATIAAVFALREAGVRLVLVSGGIRQAIVPFARELDFAIGDVHAVDVVLDGGGSYWSYDAGSPLATQGGKQQVVRAVLAAAGADARPALAAYVGFARREPVVAAADHVVDSFSDLQELVLG
jgi:phosphoserine phosphatase